ncbi:MAG: immunoglobulin domain-containing protein [Verrucomicrobiales bacterium]|nr:immunoglobulin domain-containing protein [Verrucomicrobiales bacterium]
MNRRNRGFWGNAIGYLILWCFVARAAEPVSGPGALDRGFPVGEGPDGSVWQVAPLADGRLVVGGAFRHYNGVAVPGLARLRPDGALDPTFQAAPPRGTEEFWDLYVLPDGRLLAGGKKVVRLNPDGGLDRSYSIADGAAGMEGFLDGSAILYGSSLQRLLPDGRPDPGFSVSLQFLLPSFPYSSTPIIPRVIGLEDGSFLAIGQFNRFGSDSCFGFNRITKAGQLDRSFEYRAGDNGSWDKEIARDPDGRIVVASWRQSGLARVLADGLQDASFVTTNQFTNGDFTYSEPAISRLAIQANRKILVAGTFGGLNGQVRPSLVRLQRNGTVDPTFDAGSGVAGPVRIWAPDELPRYLRRINQVQILADGAILLVGGFTNVQGVARPYLARLAGGEVPAPPVILEQPQSSTVEEMQPARFSVDVQSESRLSYLWYFNGSPLDSKTNATLDLPTVRVSEAGDYWVEVVNSVDTVRSAVARLTVMALARPAVSVMPIDTTVAQGTNLVLVAKVAGLPAPSVRWQRDGVDLPSATSTNLVLLNLQPSDAGSYRVVARNSKGEAYSEPLAVVVRWMHPVAPGRLDTSFYAALNPKPAAWVLSPGEYSPVDALVQDAQGRFLVAQRYRSVLRLRADGSPDPSFNPGSGPTGSPEGCISGRVPPTASGVRAIAVQPDGRLVLAGIFTAFNGVPASGLIGLRENGSVDPDFQASPGLTGGGWPEGSVLRALGDGRVLVGGTFEQLQGQPMNRLGRLLADGRVDTSFDPGSGATDGGIACSRLRPYKDYDGTAVRNLYPRADGGFLVSGWFSKFNGNPVTNSFARLGPDGTLDRSYSAIPEVRPDLIAFQPDGKIVGVMGWGLLQGVQVEASLRRWNPNGTPDAGFLYPNIERSQGTTKQITSLLVDRQGRIYVAGEFTVSVGTSIRRNLARLNPDGSVDASWGAPVGPEDSVTVMLLDDRENLILGGWFMTVDGLPRPGMARLFGDWVAGPRIHSITARSDHFALSVQTVLGRPHLLERRQRWGSGDWMPASDVVQGDGSLKTFNAPVSGQATSFFRVRVE